MSKVIKAKKLKPSVGEILESMSFEHDKKPARKVSAGDLKLQKYYDLDLQVKALTKERDDAKADLKHQGTHATSNYVCTVDDKTRTNPPALKVLVEAYGPSVKDLCTVSEFKQVKVSKKGGAE